MTRADGPPAPAFRATAALPTGVHMVPRERATDLVRGQLRGEPAEEPPPIVWIDISNPSEAEARYLRDEIGFHPLAVEDCIRGRQRPKLDRYHDYFFLVVYAAAVNPERNRMALNELHVFVGERFLVTVHDHRVSEVAEIIARWRAAPDRFPDSGALAHLLLDVIVDDYFTVVEHFAERAESLESALFDAGSAGELSAVLTLRHELTLFRRTVAPQRDVLGTLLRRDLPFLRPELAPYLQDVHDHIIRVTEEIDAQRELISAVLEARMTASTNQLNHTMRTLTAWSIILMSMALVAGVYGMNFVAMPELRWRYGYAFALVLMAGTGVALVSFFHRRGWL